MGATYSLSGDLHPATNLGKHNVKVRWTAKGVDLERERVQFADWFAVSKGYGYMQQLECTFECGMLPNLI